jgi:hypothetical protein
MEKIWAALLSQLSSPDPEFTYDDVREWPLEAFEDLNGAGLISEMASATHVVCDACEEAHWEWVRWSEDGKRAFIPCTATGIANVKLERLRRWRVDVGRFAFLLAAALELTQRPEPAASLSPLWRLGRRRVGGMFRDFFLSVSAEEDLSAAIRLAHQQLSSGSGLLITTSRGLDDSGWEPSRLKIAMLTDITTWSGGKIVLDLDFIEDIYLRDSMDGKKSGTRSLSIPEGVGWQDLLIEVADAGLTITASGFQRELIFEDAGFSARDQRLETLRILAAGHGRLAPERVTSVLRGKTPIKNRVNALRQALQALIPIDGNPVEYNKSARVYVCKFQLRLAGQESFPTPASASWLDFRFVERRDGRLAVSVNQKKVFRSLQTDRASGRLVEEVGQRDEIVPHLYSLEDLKLRNAKGQLTREGSTLTELLRGDGRLKRRGDDTVILKLAAWLREWVGLEGDPLHYSGSTESWTATFECSSEHGR